MKFIIFFPAVLLLLIACEEPEPDITPNLNAIASFEECIPLSFSFSQKVEIDTLLITEIQKALQLARTIDIELQDISPYISTCPPYKNLEVHFISELDSTLLVDSCLTGYSLLDSLFLKYAFNTCIDPEPWPWVENGFSYVFNTAKFLNLRVLGEMIVEIPGILSAGHESTICDVIMCGRVSLSILSDIYTFNFIDICSNDAPTEWVIVVYNNKATLISKTS